MPRRFRIPARTARTIIRLRARAWIYNFHEMMVWAKLADPPLTVVQIDMEKTVAKWQQRIDAGETPSVNQVQMCFKDIEETVLTLYNDDNVEVCYAELRNPFHWKTFWDSIQSMDMKRTLLYRISKHISPEVFQSLQDHSFFVAAPPIPPRDDSMVSEHNSPFLV